ncbi:MAG: hypothetical protein HKM04_08405 [Legionellales bacterium]|nr:hypothetical protein [Legionellales bacterium]
MATDILFYNDTGDNQFDNFFKNLNKETNDLIDKKWSKEDQEAIREQEKARYGYILSKHKVLILRQISAQIDTAYQTCLSDQRLKNIYPSKKKVSNDERLKELDTLRESVAKALRVELQVRIDFLKQGLAGHPNQDALILKLNSKILAARNNLNKTPDIFMEVEGELAFRLEYDSSSLFIKTGYNDLAKLYKQVSETKLTDDSLKSGVKFVANWMVNRALPENDEKPQKPQRISNSYNDYLTDGSPTETSSQSEQSEDEIRVEDDNPNTGLSEDFDSLSTTPKTPKKPTDPILAYQKKLEDAKFEQYKRLQRTFVDMTEKTKSSYRKDLGNRLVNRVIPDGEVINHFINTDIRSYGANGLDTDLHKVFVLMMKTDTTDGVTIELLNTLKNEYFSATFNQETGKYEDAFGEELTAARAQQNMQDFLSKLVSSMALILQKQMEEGGSDKKPALVKPLNNLLRKYDHPYRIGKVKIEPPTSEETIVVQKNAKVESNADNIRYRLTLVEQKLLTAREHTVKKVIKPRVGLFAVSYNVLIGLGAGGLTAAAVLGLLFPWATLPVALFIGLCGVYVNYKLYHYFFKPFIMRIFLHGLKDALFGKGAPLNIFVRAWEKSNILGKIAIAVFGFLFLGFVVSPIVFGFAALVGFATMNSMMLTGMAMVAGMPVLVVGLGFLALGGLLSTFFVHLPVILEVTMGFAKTTWDLVKSGLKLIYGKEGDSNIKRFFKALIILPLMALLTLPVLALIKANILTGKEFQSATANFGNNMRRFFSFFPSTTRMSVVLQRLGLPGITMLSISGLFNSVRGIGFEMVIPAVLKFPGWVKNKFAEMKKQFNSNDGAGKPKVPKNDNPWQGNFEKVVQGVDVVTDGTALLVNGFGNGVISGVEAKSVRAGIAVTVLGGMSSFFSCILGFLGLKKTSIGKKGAMVEINNTYAALDAKINKSSAGDMNSGGDAAQKREKVAKNEARNNEVPANQSENATQEEIVATKPRQQKSVTEKCHGFFEKIQSRDYKTNRDKIEEVASKVLAQGLQHDIETHASDYSITA